MLVEDLLTNEIVEKSLKNDKGQKAILISWSHENCTKLGDNFFNVAKRINVIFSKEGKEDKTSYVAKLNPCRENDSFNPYRQRAMLKEVFFYRELLPALNLELEKLGERGLRVPKYLYSSTEAEKEVIVLEDLRLKGFECFSREFPMDDAHATVMVNEIARFHAAGFLLQKTYGERDLEEVFPLLEESFCSSDVKLKDAFNEVFKKGVRLNVSLLKCMEEYRDVEPVLQKLLALPMEAIVKELQSSGPWRGICHGDYHRTNVLFRCNEQNVAEEVMILDWQTVRVAHPASEISYFISSSLFGSSRDKYIQLILDDYCKTYSRIVGPANCYFTKEELETKAKANNFGLLMCFFFIPMSLCVDDHSEMFTVDSNEVKRPEEEALRKAKYWLKTRECLNSIMKGYSKEIMEANLFN